MKKATEKQLVLIQKMEQMLDVEFKGSSISEASDFISKHMNTYKEKQEFVFDMIYYDDVY